MSRLLLIPVVLLLAATLLPFWRHKAWWVRVWDFPRLQLALLTAVMLPLLWFFPTGAQMLDGAALAAMLACLLWQLRCIAPYTRFAPTKVPDAPPGATGNGAAGRDGIRLLSANVLMENRDASRLLTQIRSHRPDVFVTLESDAWWQAQLDGLAGDYPHTCKCALDNRYGMHVYSALPIVSAETRYLISADVPSMHLTLRLRRGRDLRMHVLHPRPPSPTEADTSKQRDAELVTVGHEVATEALPVVVAGDLNDVAWSRTTRRFVRISGMLDPRRGRGMYNTFHAEYWFMRFPLDHVFHTRHFELAEIQRLGSIGSDHFPILVDLRLVD